MNGADIMVKCLEEEGVEVLYGYPGVAICPFYNSILSSDIEAVLIRTEQNAAHSASGYARMTGRPGVCAVTSGPGATNLITGIATAFADSIPLICITGQVKSELIGCDVFQEADITGAVESFVKYSYLVKNVKDLPRIFKEAFHIANTGRKGPVLIDVPIDIQQAEVSKFVYPEEVSLRTYKPTVKGHSVQIKKVVAELEKAKRPIICVGGGIHLSEATSELREFSEKHGIPVVCTMMGISAMPSEHPLYFGMVGNNGRKYANRAMNEADLIIIAGARVADRAISQPDLITKGKILVHIDVDPAEIGKNAGASIPLVGDVRHIFRDFEEYEIHADYSEWVATLQEYKRTMPNRKTIREGYVDPASFVDKLSKAIGKDSVYVADVGQNQIWSCRYYHNEGGRFLTSGGMGTMGYSIPAAIGAKMACPEKKVVAVCGDGSFQMSMMELATMCQAKVPVKVVVMKNQVLGMVREYQHYTYKDHYSVIDLSGSPDIGKIAEAYGIPFIRVHDASEVDAALEKFLEKDEAYMMECLVDPQDLVQE